MIVAQVGDESANVELGVDELDQVWLFKECLDVCVEGCAYRKGRVGQLLLLSQEVFMLKGNERGRCAGRLGNGGGYQHVPRMEIP